MRQYAFALIEKPHDEGLTRSEVCDLYDMLSGMEVIPVDIQAEHSAAMGFVGIEDAEALDYDLREAESYIRSILEDMEKENNNCEYKLVCGKGEFWIWLSRIEPSEDDIPDLVPEEIIKAKENGILETLFPSGTSVKTTLGNNKVIFDIARDSKRTYLVMHDILPEPHVMNMVQKCKGGWPATDMRRYVHGLFEKLPSSVKKLAIPVSIRQIAQDEIVKCKDSAFLLSAVNVFGKDVREPETDCGDEQLDIFIDSENRAKSSGTSTESTFWWWLRSPYYSYCFCFVDEDGNLGDISADVEGGVVIALCIEVREPKD